MGERLRGGGGVEKGRHNGRNGSAGRYLREEMQGERGMGWLWFWSKWGLGMGGREGYEKEGRMGEGSELVIGV